MSTSVLFRGFLAWVSELKNWSDATLYGAMTLGLVFFGLVGALALARERGPAVFGEREPAPRPGARH